MAYQPLPLDDDYESQAFKPESFQNSETRPSKLPQRLACLTLILSIFMNVFLVQKLTFGQGENQCNVSGIAGLQYDFPTAFHKSTDFSKEDSMESNEHWDSIDISRGVVALDEAFAESKSLPMAQPFPWDTTKGIYLLNGFHSLHCAKSIHSSLIEFQLQKTQSYPFEHILHCLDALRLDTICHADDTPRYTTNTRESISGIGQYRQCKDWSKLESWATKHDACYRYFNESFNDIPDQRQRYLFCQPGSPYATEVEKYIMEKSGL